MIPFIGDGTYTQSGIARVFDVTRNTVNLWLEDGLLYAQVRPPRKRWRTHRGMRIVKNVRGSDYMIDAADVRAYLESKKQARTQRPSAGPRGKKIEAQLR